MRKRAKNPKVRVNRIISSLLVLMMSFFLSDGTYAANAATLSYPKAYTIGNVLSDYQYFTQGDLTATSSGHSVGAVAVGGTLDTQNTVGDGQVAPTYVNNVKNLLDFKQGKWIDDSTYSTYKVTQFYYNTCVTANFSSKMWLIDTLTNNPGYIDFGTAFNSLKQESQGLSDQGTNSYSVDQSNKLTITLDSTKDTFVTIPYSILKSASSIQLAGLSSIQDFVNHKYVISITGVNSDDGMLSFYNMYFNTTPFDMMIKNQLDGGENGGQLNLNGMKLIWNFPDATGDVNVTSLNGHLVAPQANVSVFGGRFEGGVIAKSVNTNSEGHYYTFYKPGTTPETGITSGGTTSEPSTSVTTGSGVIINEPSTGGTGSGGTTSEPSTGGTGSGGTTTSESSTGGTGSGGTTSESSTAEATPQSITSTGIVIDSKTGQTVQAIETKVVTEADQTKTVLAKSEEAILFKAPDGTTSPLTDVSKLEFLTTEDLKVSILPDGNIQFKNLDNGSKKDVQVTFDIGNGQKIIIGNIHVQVAADGSVNVVSELIDPYGIITDSTTGKVIPGVDITLYYANTDRNRVSGKTPDTIVKLPGINGFKPNNNSNPQISDGSGAYGYMVLPYSDYYIVAIKDGYIKYISPTISVEDKIVKHDIKMDKINSPEITSSSITNNQTKDNGISPQTGENYTTDIFMLMTFVSAIAVLCLRKKRIGR